MRAMAYSLQSERQSELHYRFRFVPSVSYLPKVTHSQLLIVIGVNVAIIGATVWFAFFPRSR